MKGAGEGTGDRPQRLRRLITTRRGRWLRGDLLDGLVGRRDALLQFLNGQRLARRPLVAPTGDEPQTPVRIARERIARPVPVAASLLAGKRRQGQLVELAADG